MTSLLIPLYGSSFLATDASLALGLEAQSHLVAQVRGGFASHVAFLQFGKNIIKRDILRGKKHVERMTTVLGGLVSQKVWRHDILFNSLVLLQFDCPENIALARCS